jgi:kynurenine formamidase
MRKIALNILAVLCVSVAAHYWVFGQSGSETPIGAKWWPSEWGADDQRGAANRLTAGKVLEARELIREGRIYQLGRPYEHGMPVPGKRHYSLTIPGLPTGKPAPESKNQLVHNDELISGELGQIGTQFDGLGHVGVRVGEEDLFYNGLKLSEFGDTYGLKKLGIENVGPIFTRGVLLDVAAIKGKSLSAGEVVRAAHLQQAAEAAKIALRPGDVVLVHTGHGQLWMQDNEKYAAGEPGIGMEAAEWLASQHVALVGADTWAVEVIPSENTERPFEVHQFLLTRNGIYLIENLDLSELARDKVHEFAFLFSPLRLKGATGSPGNPIAVR